MPTFILRYSTYLGGTGTERIDRVRAAPDKGDVVAGSTSSADFPTTTGVFQPTFGGGTNDVFVAKFTANGALVFATFLGGSGDDEGFGVALDAAQNLYVVGQTTSTNFPTQTPFQAALSGPSDAFVTKLNPNASALIFSTYLGGTADDFADDVRVDAQGRAIVAGATDSVDFPTMNPIQAANAGGLDAFVTKFTAAGTALVYSTYLGGTADDVAFSLDLDAAGAPVVVGQTSSANYPTVAGSFDTTFGGTSDGFVTKLNAAGSALLYSGFLGGALDDSANDVVVDPDGSVFVTGSTDSANFPTTPGVFQGALMGPSDAFLTHINAAGTTILASTYLGGTDFDSGLGIALHPTGTPVVTGATSSTDFPVTTTAFQRRYGGGPDDAFLTWMTRDLRAEIYSTFLGGLGDDAGFGVTVHPDPDITVVGPTASPNFPLKNAFQPVLRGPRDGFVTRFTPAQVRFPVPLFTGGVCPPGVS